MKNTLLTLLGFMLVNWQMATAQTTSRVTDGNIPDVVLNAYKAKYQNTPVKDWDWEEDKNLYEAEFTMNGKEHEAYFSPDGVWQKTKKELKKEEFPAAVSKALSSGEYSSWKAGDRMEMDTPNHGKVYKVKVEKGEEEFYLKYDATGKLIDKKSKAEKKAMDKK